MTHEEITQRNEAIAMYMGWKVLETAKSKPWMLSEMKEGLLCAIKEVSADRLLFNSSWDWLMPVVEKIITDRQSDFGIDSPGYYSSDDTFQVFMLTDNVHSVFQKSKSMLEAVWLGVSDYCLTQLPDEHPTSPV